MLDIDRLFDDLAAIGLAGWRAPLEPLVRERLSDGAHGDLPRWRAALAALAAHAALPTAEVYPATLDAAVVAVGPPAFEPAARETVRTALLALKPWRKGPFRVGDIHVDAEWRSDLKWARLGGAVAPLAGRRILDAGCGNGYYALRMLGEGAAAVVGIDPTLTHLVQFQAIRHWLPPGPAPAIMPVRLDELPPDAAFFDTVFSMGVLYHQREPLVHLAQLRRALAAGGELVLETLVLPGEDAEVRERRGRYARMRNVWHLPTAPGLLAWLEDAGFGDARLIDVTMTTPQEQRRTEWMPFESLAEALDPADPALTIEGWPAPRRAVALATRS